MYSGLESHPVRTTHPIDPQHQILHYTLTKSAVLSSQSSIQVAFPRPAVFIPSSRSSSHSPRSSPEFSMEEVNRRSVSVTKSFTMSSHQPPSFSNRALPQGRPLPQVPPLPLSLGPIQPMAIGSPNSANLPNPSPITSPSSPTTLHRPKRALPIIPPSPRTPQMTFYSHLSNSPASRSLSSSDAPTPSQSSSVERLSKGHVSLSVDLSSTIEVIHHLPPLRHKPRTRKVVCRINAEASSSKVQLPPQSLVPLDLLLSPPSSPEPKVQTPPLPEVATDNSHRESRPKLRIHTPLTEPDPSLFDRKRHRLPQRIQPLPRVPIQPESADLVLNLPRRSSLDSLTTCSSTLSPGQALSPYVSKRLKSSGLSTSPQLQGLNITEMRTVGRNEQGPAPGRGMEPISPMKFVRDSADEESDEELEYRWNEPTSERVNHSVVQDPATSIEGVLVSSNTTVLNPTANEVINKHLDRMRHRRDETAIRESGVDPKISIEKEKGKSRAHGVDQVVLSEGEEGETDDEDDFYQPSPWPGRQTFADYQNCVSDRGYGYGHDLAQDLSGQPEVYGNPHFVGTAYGHHRASGNVTEDADSDPGAFEDADNKTPAVTFPPRSVARMLEIEDEMVFERPKAIFKDLEDDDEYPHKERRAVTNARPLTSNEPVSSDSDLALGGERSRGSSFQDTRPSSSHYNSTSRKLVKQKPHPPMTTQNQSNEKFGSIRSVSSSSSFVTSPPSSFQDPSFPYFQNTGRPTPKPFGRKWGKEKGGQRWKST